MIFPLVAVGIMSFYSACNRPISTKDDWVYFCKCERNVEAVYNKFMSMSPTNSIAVYRALADELAADDKCQRETCYAFVYMMSLLTLDIGSHPEKYSLENIAQFNDVADNNPDDYLTAVLHSVKQTGDVSTEIQTFKILLGSNISTVEEWVKFSRENKELDVIYKMLEKITPDNLIDIYVELSSVVGNDNTINTFSSKDVCFAYWYIYAFISIDSDVNRNKYTVAQMDRFERIMELQTDLNAQNNTIRHIGEAKLIDILKYFATFSGSQKYQNYWN